MQTTHTRTSWKIWLICAVWLVGAGLLSLPSPVQAQCGAMDVAFVIDDTSSLQGSLNNIKSELNAILDDIQKASGNDYRLSLVTFKDDVTVLVNFSSQNRAEITTKILALNASGGERIPEASDEALNTVINSLSATGRPQTGNFSIPFRTSAFKVIILLTDAVPGGFDDTYVQGVDDVNAHNFAVQAKNKNIKISAIYVPTYADDTPFVKPIMQDYASTTAGFYLETNRDGTGTANAIKTIIAGCGSTSTTPTLGQGIPSETKAGSVLFYNLYASDAVRPNLENTMINLTNTDEEKAVLVHLFFVDSATCNVADMFVCIPPTHHRNILASDYDPGNTGYVVAVAVGYNGCPLKFNGLIGSANIKLKTGHKAHLNAVAFEAIVDSPAICDFTEETATLRFDGEKYDFSPRILAVQNFASPIDASTLLVVNRFGGNLTKQDTVGMFGNLAAVFYNDAEKGASVTLNGNACQTRNELKDGYPRVIPRFSLQIPTGRTGWMRFSAGDNAGIMGATLSYSPNSLRIGGTNLPAVALMSSEKYVIPITVPDFTCP